jgi:hypothetical protein
MWQQVQKMKHIFHDKIHEKRLTVAAFINTKCVMKTLMSKKIRESKYCSQKFCHCDKYEWMIHFGRIHTQYDCNSEQVSYTSINI